MENKILSIEKTVEKIEKLLNSNVIEKAKKYDETIALLNKIDFQATSSIEVDEANGEKFVKIEYSIPVAKVRVNDDHELECEEHFRAINLLNLLPISTIEKISKEIEIIKKFNK